MASETRYARLEGDRIAYMVASWALLALLARRLPPGPLRELARFIPDCVTAVRRLRGDPRVSRRAKVAVLLARLRLASPIDLLPEFPPVIGPLDDVVVVALALRYAAHQLPRAGSCWRPGRAIRGCWSGCWVPNARRPDLGRGHGPRRSGRWTAAPARRDRAHLGAPRGVGCARLTCSTASSGSWRVDGGVIVGRKDSGLTAPSQSGITAFVSL